VGQFDSSFQPFKIEQYLRLVDTMIITSVQILFTLSGRTHRRKGAYLLCENFMHIG
jgi:hypothetical protein